MMINGRHCSVSFLFLALAPLVNLLRYRIDINTKCFRYGCGTCWRRVEIKTLPDRQEVTQLLRLLRDNNGHLSLALAMESFEYWNGE
jgi:hypothetical protein